MSTTPAASETVSGFTLWELISIYLQRQHDPDKFSPYELRNGPAADREPELAYLVYAHWKEGIDDTGRSGRSPPTCPAPMDAQTPDTAGRRPHRCTPFSMQVLPAAHMCVMRRTPASGGSMDG